MLPLSVSEARRGIVDAVSLVEKIIPDDFSKIRGLLLSHLPEVWKQKRMVRAKILHISQA